MRPVVRPKMGYWLFLPPLRHAQQAVSTLAWRAKHYQINSFSRPQTNRWKAFLSENRAFLNPGMIRKGQRMLKGC